MPDTKAGDLDEVLALDPDKQLYTFEPGVEGSGRRIGLDKFQSKLDLSQFRFRTEAEVRAEEAANRAQYAGSGFVEWGKHLNGANNEPINTGLFSSTLDNRVLMGWGLSSGTGESRTDFPLVNVTGKILNLELVGNQSAHSSTIMFPPAPSAEVESSTTTTANYAQGDFVVNGNDIYVALEPATAGDLLTDDTKFSLRTQVSRQDFAFIEVWEEAISSKDFWYPLGNVQYGQNDWKTVGSLGNSVVAPEYSAYGAWETAPVAGYGHTWSTLSEAEKQTIAENDSSVFVNAAGELIQKRFRVRTVAGIGDVWLHEDGQSPDAFKVIATGKLSRTSGYCINAQGQNTSLASDLRTGSGLNGTSFIYSTKDVAGNSGKFIRMQEDGGIIRSSIFPMYRKEIGVLLVPICLVQRRNKGGYHPVYNDCGTRRWNRTDQIGHSEWYIAEAIQPANVADCFKFGASDSTEPVNLGSGKIGNTSGHPSGLFYDAIYERDVQDLRMNANRIEDYDRELFKLENQFLNNELRGFVGQRRCRRIELRSGLDFTGGNTVVSQSIFGVDGITDYRVRHGIEFARNLSAVGYPSGDLGGQGGLVFKHNNEFYKLFQSGGSSTALLAKKRIGGVWTSGDYVTELGGFPEFTAFPEQPMFAQPAYDDSRITRTRHSQAVITQCDIIGDPVNYPAEWFDFGVTGNSLMKDDQGNSLLPADVGYTVPTNGAASHVQSKRWKLSGKFESSTITVIRWDGTNYTVLPNNTQAGSWSGGGTSPADNSIYLHEATWGTNFTDNDVFMVFYDAPAVATDAISNGEVVALSSHSTCFIDNACIAGPSLTGKVSTGTTNPRSARSPHGSYAFAPNTKELSVTGDIETGGTGVLASEDSPAAIYISYLSRSEDKGIVELNFVFKDMIYNAPSDYGESGQSVVVNGMTDVADDNGNRILVGTKSFRTNRFITDAE